MWYLKTLVILLFKIDEGSLSEYELSGRRFQNFCLRSDVEKTSMVVELSVVLSSSMDEESISLS